MNMALVDVQEFLYVLTLTCRPDQRTGLVTPPG
jgi:hypothetical protein